MQLLPAVLVAFSLFDVLPSQTAPIAIPPQPERSIADAGLGQLSVTVSSPRANTVARGATRVPFAVLDLSASCDADITVHAISVTHTGLGRSSDLLSVNLADDGRRLTRSQAFDARRPTATLRFSRPLVLKKCDVQQLTILADVSPVADSAGEHAITVKYPTDIDSSAKETVLGSLTGTQTVFTTPDHAASISVKMLPVSGRIRYGRTETVARLQLSADQQSAHLLKKITLTNLGDARDYELLRFTLETPSGQVLTDYAHHMRGKTVTLEFRPSFVLHSSQTIVLLVRAEVRASQTRTVNFVLEEPSDFIATQFRER